MSALRELLLLRHAKSDHSNLSLPDFDRPLNERGREDAHTIGRWIVQQQLHPDFILCSPSKRTLQTLKRAQTHFDANNQIPCVTDKNIYQASLEALLTALANVFAQYQRVLLVGHNPGLESLITYLTPTDKDDDSVKLFPTSALAHLIMPTNWQSLSAGSAKLVNLWRVKQLPSSGL
jgi:phosphohistidine phosphatase